MKILNVEPPISRDGLYSGLAISKRGRRYDWTARGSGNVVSAHRENPDFSLPDGRTYWHVVVPPRSLKQAVRGAVLSR